MTQKKQPAVDLLLNISEDSLDEPSKVFSLSEVLLVEVKLGFSGIHI